MLYSDDTIPDYYGIQMIYTSNQSNIYFNPNKFIPQRDDLIQIKDWPNVDSNPGRFLSLLI